jgi:hypothetical protein
MQTNERQDSLVQQKQGVHVDEESPIELPFLPEQLAADRLWVDSNQETPVFAKVQWEHKELFSH